MAYRFKRKESVPDAVRRVVGEEIDAASSDLAPKSDDLHEGVHEARKHFKKIRAVLRLVRSEIGDETFRSENRWFRDTSRRLSDARDAEAMIEAYDKLRDQFSGPFERRSFRAIRKAFVRRRDAMTQDIAAFDRVVADVRAELASVGDRARSWRIDGTDFAAIGPGLRRIYRNGRRALAEATDDPTPEHFHEMRKRVKDLWYHVRLLRNAWPEILLPLEESLKVLSDLLGDDHDLVVFRHLLGEGMEVLEESEARELIEFVERSRGELEREAIDLARRVYAEKPSAFHDRIETYWLAWRQDPPAATPPSSA